MNELKAMVRSEMKADEFIEIFKTKKNYDSLNKLSLEELRTLNSMIVSIIKNRRDGVGSNVKRALSVGDVVTVKSKKTEGDIFEIVKLNPKKAVIKNVDGFKFDCPYALLITV